MAANSSHTALDQLIARQHAVWPEHSDYIAASMQDREPDVMETSDIIAQQVFKLAAHVEGGVDRLIRDYRYLCQDIMLPEEIHFRRHDEYRLKTFADAYREVYGNAPLMEHYMNGLLVSNVFWSNHARAANTYRTRFLPRLKPGARHLEVGPGHGLLVFLAARLPGMTDLTGWDVSETSVASTKRSLAAMGIATAVKLECKDAFAKADPSQDGQFDSIVLSEVLEHLEQPVAALRQLRAWLKPGGLLWINVPANSPAPDHLYLLRAPEEAAELAKEAGLDVVEAENFPMSGATLERARRQQLTVTCIVTARRPA